MRRRRRSTPHLKLTAKLAAARDRAALARLPAEYHAIAGLAEVTRGDVAAVLGIRLADLLARRTQPGALVTDVRSHWASSLDSRRGAGRGDGADAEPYLPAAAAGPSRRSRADRQPRAGAHRGGPARLGCGLAVGPRDDRRTCRPSHPTYPAVSQAVAAGVLPLAGDAFTPSGPVSGTELLGAVERLEALAAPTGGRRRR